MAIYQKKSTGDYYVDLYVSGRRKRWKVGSNRRQAELVESKLKVEIVEDKYMDMKKDSGLTFSEFADRYILEHSKVENKSWCNDEQRMKLLKAEFGNRPLSSIEIKDIVQFKSKLLSRKKASGKTVRPATVNRYLMLLKGMYSRAIDWGVFHGVHPCQRVKALREDNEKNRYLSLEEIHELLAQCRGELADVVGFALSTGMRAGEIVGLNWTDVDFTLGLIYIRRSGKMTYSPKSGKSRVVPMNDGSRRVLMNRSGTQIGMQSNQSVFTGRHWDGYQAAVARANLNPEGTNDIDKVVFHTLRHTFASHLAIKGVDLYRIAKLLGDTFQVAEKRYAHLQPKHLQEVRMLDNIWSVAAIENKENPVKRSCPSGGMADTTDLKSVGELNLHAGSSPASGNVSDRHHIDTKGEAGGPVLNRNRGDPWDLKSVGELNPCGSSSLPSGIFLCRFSDRRTSSFFADDSFT